MQIVIDIPEHYYENNIKKELPIYLSEDNIVAILPKGHGRLIDADYLKDVILLHSFHGNNKCIVPYSDRKGYRLRDREVLEGIINAPTIVESDGGDAK